MNYVKKGFKNKSCSRLNDCGNYAYAFILNRSRILCSSISSISCSSNLYSSNKLEFINRVKNIRCELIERRLKK